MNQLLNRMIRAARLDISLYEEVEADVTASGQAVVVVILSSLATGIGSFAILGVKGLVINTFVALLGWYIWAYLAYYIGTKMLPEPQTSSNPGELLRTIGFSSSPGIIRVLGIIPVLNVLVNVVAGIWMLITFVVAVRQALDYRSTGRAILVCVIGWLIYIIVTVFFNMLTGWMMN